MALSIQEWIYLNIANILIIIAVLGIAALAVIRLVRGKKEGRSSCGCGCAICAMTDECCNEQEKNNTEEQ